MWACLTTVFDDLESPLLYEYNGAIKGQFGANFDKTQDSTVAVLELLMHCRVLRLYLIVIRYGGQRVVLRRWMPKFCQSLTEGLGH